MIDLSWWPPPANADPEQVSTTWSWTQAHHHERILQHLPPDLDQTGPS